MSQPEALSRYLAQKPLPFPVLADPDREGYAAFRIGRTTWTKLMRPGTIWRYLKWIARGWSVHRVPKGEDALQEGGDFLLNGDRQLVWEFRSGDPTIRPSVDELLRVIRERFVDERTPLA